jgi:hypothetical protein
MKVSPSLARLLTLSPEQSCSDIYNPGLLTCVALSKIPEEDCNITYSNTIFSAYLFILFSKSDAPNYMTFMHHKT